MRCRLLFGLCLAALLVLRPTVTTGQDRQPQTQGSFPFGAPISDTQSYESHGGLLIVTVYDEKKKPLDRQSLVKLENGNTHDTLWQATTDKSEAPFTNLGVGPYEIEVSAVGYLTAHKSYSLGTAYNTHRIEVSLQRDPSAISLEQPNAPDLPAKARKAVQRAVRDLKSRNLKHARKELDAALKVAPESAEINFFLGYLEFAERNYSQAQAFLVKAVTRDTRNVQALTLLGRVRLLRGDYPAAGATLDEAVLADPSSWLAHLLLAEASLGQHDFEKARHHSQIALDKGKGAATSARLTLGQALANLGNTNEAIEVLETFLRGTTDKTDAERVRDYIAELRVRQNQTKTAPVGPLVLSSSSSIDDTDFRLSIKTWEPTGIDDSNPVVASGVSCPVNTVLTEAGLRVKQLADDIGRFGAIEELQHERVDELGHAITKDTRRYNYVAAISEKIPGYLEVDEYRLEHSSLAQYPDSIASSGFTTLAFVFHPNMQPTFEFACEGLGEWRGKSTWLVHFRQREDQPNRIHDIKIGGMIYPINLKGRAWVSADTFQIVHMESQLIKPLPSIQLLTEHQIVDYGPVQFKKSEQLWLPTNAELYFDFRKHRYHRRHSFSHFMLFSTSSQETVQEPKQKPGVPQPKEETR